MTNKLGFKGVTKTSNGRFSARIKNRGVEVHLGTFDTIQEAGAAYKSKAEELFGAGGVWRRAAELTGQTFGRLTVGLRVRRGDTSFWECSCVCGGSAIVRQDRLLYGATKSCGCLALERLREYSPIKYGAYGTRLYKIWVCMLDRCYNDGNTNYRHYGGRGITLCDEWRNNFWAFQNWASLAGYRDNLTIDRIDVNLGYEPVNCRWVSRSQQGKEGKRCLRAVVRSDGEYFPTIAAAAQSHGVTTGSKPTPSVQKFSNPEDRLDPYFLSVMSLRSMFRETGAYVRYLEDPAAPDDWRAHSRLQREIIDELFPRRKRPANMASGFSFNSKCSIALRELLEPRGLMSPPEPTPPMPLSWRIRMAWRELRMRWNER